MGNKESTIRRWCQEDGRYHPGVHQLYVLHGLIAGALVPSPGVLRLTMRELLPPNCNMAALATVLGVSRAVLYRHLDNRSSPLVWPGAAILYRATFPVCPLFYARTWREK